ncbi:MAG: redoxin domain-containing protein [Rhodocyclaceae bacterium]|nr:redoxin domain-containing protein [Rhodocyclaceae bacterium]
MSKFLAIISGLLMAALLSFPTWANTMLQAGDKAPDFLLADGDGKVSRQYGALNNFAIVKFAKRHTFLIDPEGRIAKAYRDVEPSRHAGEVIADLKQLRTDTQRRPFLQLR